MLLKLLQSHLQHHSHHTHHHITIIYVNFPWSGIQNKVHSQNQHIRDDKEKPSSNKIPIWARDFEYVPAPGPLDMRTLSQHPWLMNPQFLLVLLELLPSTKKGPFLFNLWGLWLGIYFKLRCSVQFSCSVTFNSLQSHGPQHTRLFCPSLTPRASSNSCPSSQWWHPTI